MRLEGHYADIPSGGRDLVQENEGKFPKISKRGPKGGDSIYILLSEEGVHKKGTKCLRKDVGQYFNTVQWEFIYWPRKKKLQIFIFG